MEKLFTVEDIAGMTSVTTRTIRNYLKDGILKGRKIGGQWRFTEEDIKNLMDNGAYKKDATSTCAQEVMDFIDGVNTAYTAEVQACTIIDLYHGKEVIDAKKSKLLEFVNSNALNPEYMRFFYEYVESESKGRFVIFAPPEYLIEALKILQ